MADYSPWVNHGWVRGEITTDFTDKHGWGRLLSFILYFASMAIGSIIELTGEVIALALVGLRWQPFLQNGPIA